MGTETAVGTTPHATATGHREHRTAKYALVLGGLTAFGPLSVDMYLPALPAMTRDLSSGDTAMQLTLAAFIVGLGIGQLVVGPLSDALGRRRPLLVGIAVFVVASVLCAISPSAETLIAARTLQAFGAAAGVVIARATVRDLYSGVAMARFFSMLMLVTGLAPILAPVIGGQLLTVTSWRGIFWALTGFGVLLLTVAAFALPEPLPPERRRQARFGPVLRTYRSLLNDRLFLGYALAVGLAFAGMFTYISGSSFVLQGVYGLSPVEYSFVFGANGLGLVAASQVNGRIVGRFRQRTLLRTGLLATTAGALGMVVATVFGLGLVGLLIPLFVLVSSIGLIMPNATSLALADHPHTAGSASALLGVVQFLVGGAASPLVGLFGENSAIPMATIMAVSGLLALLSFSTLTHRPATVAQPA